MKQDSNTVDVASTKPKGQIYKIKGLSLSSSKDKASTLNRTTQKTQVENNNETLSLTNRIKQSANFNNIKTKFKDSCNYFQNNRFTLR